jgi:hypothetical protein
MSLIGAVARSVCNPPHQARASLDADAERKVIYYIALYAEMERCRGAQVPMVIGAGIEYGIPTAPQQENGQ